MAVYDVLPETDLKVEDIRDTLIANGGSVPTDADGNFAIADLFKEEAKINQWSVRKPFIQAVDFTDTWRSGFTVEGTYESFQFMLVYVLPKGGQTMPYRLGDFRGYDTKAVAPSLEPSVYEQTIVTPGSATSGVLINIDLKNARSLMKMIKEEGVEHRIDCFKIDGSNEYMPLELGVSGETIPGVIVSTPNFGMFTPKNPGFSYENSWEGVFTDGNHPERSYRFKGLSLMFTSRLKFPLANDLTNPFSMERFQGACVHSFQNEVLGSDAVFGGLANVFQDSDLLLAWYAFSSGGIYIRMTFTHTLDANLVDTLRNNLYASGAQGNFRIFLYRGKVMGNMVYPDEYPIGGADAKPDVSYTDNYQGATIYELGEVLTNECVKNKPYLQIYVNFSTQPTDMPTADMPHLVCGIVTNLILS